MTVHDVLDTVRAHLNDSLGQIFNDTSLLPHLRVAYSEMAEMFQENELPTTNKVTSDPIVIPVTSHSIGGNGDPALPQDFIEIQGVYERTTASSEPFMELDRVDYLPITPLPLRTAFQYYTVQNQVIRFPLVTGSREVKLEYIANTFTELSAPSSLITITNSRNALAYRTAGLAASMIGENPTRAEELNGYASNALERLMNISMKSQQGIVTRRRPFRASYKARSY